MDKLFKGILDKLFKPNQHSNKPEIQPISPSEVEAIVDAKIKEHATTIQSTTTDQDDYTLSTKQIEYAISMIEKLKGEFVLAIEPSKLTIKDLNRLIAYQKYKNKGTLVNLVKKGVLQRK
ncbi:ABC transporter ATP-binding protein [Bacillus sp. 1NLA3E]|uniref:ABC transporter ATP-binding protein n=1 Tax=Bacillus sp. 1NLA3E TaxID=666686 RepID=UPI00030A3E1A|nr:ABC transporter ATP-binding protein [Bacillus sp. 1NLA3E]